MTMLYFCCDEQRREAVRGHDTLNGIDYLEVVDEPTQPLAERQRTLFVHLLKTPPAGELTSKNIRIEGGERIRGIMVISADFVALDPLILVVEVDRPGDFSTYTLRLVRGPDDPQPPANFDPLLSAIDFSFKVGCPSDFDCRTERVCPPDPLPQIEINYLAKDYASFRQLMLDRLAVLVPQWDERHAADLGMTLVELLAYVADYLSYQQDAVATEAYLGTARHRVSARRHARLVDYLMHDGCNARAWVQVCVTANVPLAQGTPLLTRVAGQEPRISPVSSAYTEALAAWPEVFETKHDVTLFKAHNEIYFYTWGAHECCLPKGATKATLRDYEEARLLLRPGDVLIFEEQFDPREGSEALADPSHRHAVRLIRVSPQAEVLPDGQRTPGLLTAAPPLYEQQYIVEIEWAAEDALPFPLCISAREYINDVSVALGNIVLVDHGLTPGSEPLGSVPDSQLFWSLPWGGDRCDRHQYDPIPPRFHPHLTHGPLTHAAPDPFQGDRNGEPDGLASASTAVRYKPQDALPVITLSSKLNGVMTSWEPRRDLLNSGPADLHFVVESDNDGTATLRFGDDRFGKRPDSETTFEALYRVGNGVQGNVGAEAIVHIVSDDPSIESVRNPMPAQGGVEPESIEDVRKNAPIAFRTQERAVTPTDYAEVAERHPQIQRAAATFRWTGSWHTVFITADRLGGTPVDSAFEGDLRQHVERYRMAGHDIEIDGPRFVPIEIDMRVCVKPDYFRSDVEIALREVFHSRTLPDGRLGIFHPDNFSFGQPVYLSHLYAAALAVEGVASVQVTRFQRRDTPSDGPLKDGILEIARLEIARLDNDPNFPDRGTLRITLEGGK